MGRLVGSRNTEGLTPLVQESQRGHHSGRVGRIEGARASAQVGLWPEVAQRVNRKRRNVSLTSVDRREDEGRTRFPHRGREPNVEVLIVNVGPRTPEDPGCVRKTPNRYSVDMPLRSWERPPSLQHSVRDGISTRSHHEDADGQRSGHLHRAQDSTAPPPITAPAADTGSSSGGESPADTAVKARRG